MENRASYSRQHNFFGATSPAQLLARFGSPLYVYNEGMLRMRCEELCGLVQHPGFMVSYSTKANGNPHLLSIIKECGLTADAMSPGELMLVKKAGFSKEQIAYVSNNISADELALAAREAAHVSVDSLSQLETLGQVAPFASVMVRLNPGHGAGHHAKVITAGAHTKFGVLYEELPAMRQILQKYKMHLAGFNQHVGSLFLDPTPYLNAVSWLLSVAEEFPGIEVIDFGGGFGIPYHKYEHEGRLDMDQLALSLTGLIEQWSNRTGYAGKFVIEPGRYAVAESGILLGTVMSVKNNGPVRYVGTDIGFSVLGRPMMYDAFHDIEHYADTDRAQLEQTLVGNICETGDVLAKNRMLPEFATGDVFGVLDAGAYGMSMASQYNQRLRPAEVLITRSGDVRLIRRRDTFEDIARCFDL